LAEFVKTLPPMFEYVSLQKDLRAEDEEVLRSCPEIRHFSEDIIDFLDTAALCDLLDLVVSVDTSVAHLAGALGRPIWILLPFNPDWRWLLNRSDSPWYSTARLYRQSTAGDWVGVLEAVNSDLSKLDGS
jgi:ADP-heptose:LPS heptosyltransferase